MLKGEMRERERESRERRVSRERRERREEPNFCKTWTFVSNFQE